MQPDITVGCMMAYLRDRQPSALSRGAYPVLERLAAACEATPWFRAVRAAADEVMPDRYDRWRR